MLAPLSHILSSLSGVSLPREGLQSLLTPNYVIVTVARRIGSKWYLWCSRRRNRCRQAQTEADKGYRSRRVDAIHRSCSIFEVVNVRRIPNRQSSQLLHINQNKLILSENWYTFSYCKSFCFYWFSLFCSKA